MEKRTKILVSKKVKDYHRDIYDEIESILMERFKDEPDYEIISEADLPDKRNKELIKAFWTKQCRFLCFASDDEHMGVNINNAIEYKVPCVMIKGNRFNEDYIDFICGLLSKEKGLKCPTDEVIQRMFFEITKVGDIRGAIAWINNFYHALKDSITKEDLSKKEEAADAGAKLVSSLV